MKVKIAIADDHPLVVSGVHHVLGSSSDMEVVGSYINGAELLAGLMNVTPDVILLDIHMPGADGGELTEIILSKYPDIKIIALTNEDNVYYVKSMFQKGVHGYLLKTSPDHILISAIRTVLSGDQYLETALKDRVLRQALLSRKKQSPIPVLSPREKEVFNYIAADLTSQEIAEKIFLSKRTIDSYRVNLMLKLDVKTVAALIKKGIQLGLIDM